MAAREPNETEKDFGDRYVACMCPRTAALEAGYSLKTARTKAYQWVSCREHKPWLYDYIQGLLEEKREKFSITTTQVLHRLWLIASADPNELAEMRRVNCRYCHGDQHAYQWTENEFLRACARAEKAKEALPDYGGGLDFDPIGEPHEGCPECRGEGVETLHLKDTRDLSPSARALFAGIEKTKDGVKIKTHDQLAALDKIGKHLGMFIERKELSAPGGAPLFPTTIELVAPGVE